LNGARRSTLINCFLVLLWLNFLLLWHLVQQATGIREAITSFVFLGGIIGVYGALLAAWIYYNIRIWRQKGPRLGLREVSREVRRDTLSREIQPSVALKSDQDIEVDVVGNLKVFANPSFEAIG
jgi:hypothetical protein